MARKLKPGENRMPATPWTDDEIAFLKEMYPLCGARKLSALLTTHSAKAIEQRAKKLQIKAPTTRAGMRYGIRSVDDLRERSVITESGCWRLRVGGELPAKCKPAKVWLSHHQLCLDSHRAAKLLQGVNINGRVIFHKCGTTDCCNPEHLSVGSHTTKGRHYSKAGTYERDATDSARATLHSRSMSHAIPAQVVEAIREAEGTHAQVAGMFGVCKDTVRLIRSGKTRAKTLPAASVFTWRP